MQKWAVFHLISKHSLNIKFPLYSLWIINEFENSKYCLINEQQCSASDFRPDKTRAASLLSVFKDIPGKACLNGVDNNDAFVNVGN